MLNTVLVNCKVATWIPVKQDDDAGCKGRRDSSVDTDKGRPLLKIYRTCCSKVGES